MCGRSGQLLGLREASASWRHCRFVSGRLIDGVIRWRRGELHLHALRGAYEWQELHRAQSTHLDALVGTTLSAVSIDSTQLRRVVWREVSVGGVFGSRHRVVVQCRARLSTTSRGQASFYNWWKGRIFKTNDNNMFNFDRESKSSKNTFNLLFKFRF